MLNVIVCNIWRTIFFIGAKMLKSTRSIVGGAILVSLSLVSTAASAIDLALIESSVPDPAEQILTRLIGNGSGIVVVPGSASFIGRAEPGNLAQSSFYSNFNLSDSTGLGPNVSIGDGVLLTTGVANFPLTNTVNDWSAQGLNIPFPPTGENSLLSGLSGGSTYNQNVISFDFVFSNSTSRSLQMNFVFGSEEFPTQSITDIFGFFVDGVNHAYFPNGDLIGNNASSNFVNNPLGSGNYKIEYNGFTRNMLLTAPVDPSLSVHTAVIAIANTNDSLYDSGVFISNIRASNKTDGGIGGPDSNSIAPVPVGSFGAIILTFFALSLSYFFIRRKRFL